MVSVLTSALQQQRVSRRLDALQQLRQGNGSRTRCLHLYADRDQEMLRTEEGKEAERRLDSLELQYTQSQIRKRDTG